MHLTHKVKKLHKLNESAASMVVEPPRVCGRVGFVLGVTGWLGRAWWDLELHGCYCMGACITGLVGVTR